MPVATLAAILGHADLRSVMKYAHFRQESQDREMELFDAKNISEAKRWSGFGPVGTAENQEFEGLTGMLREGLNDLCGEPGGARTRDHRIKSAMLYQLSYRPMRCSYNDLNMVTGEHR